MVISGDHRRFHLFLFSATARALRSGRPRGSVRWMNVWTRRVPTLALFIGTMLVTRRVAAQDHAVGSRTPSRRDSLSVMATALGTSVSPAVNSQARSDLLVTQPMLALRSSRARGRLQLAAMLNAERWTMPGGEPVAGIWGEGFIDRRHPHTVVHEFMLTTGAGGGRVRASLSGGKGFVPFGTDDPMSRPLTKYPANHHLSQVMERVLVVTALRLSPHAAIEAALFNGDEPLSPTSAPQWNRFADSRAMRVTVWPQHNLELQSSVATVRSPEFVRPDGLDHVKFSASVRWTPAQGRLQYAMVEWARTDERAGGRHVLAYGTGLAEASWRRARWSVAARAEQTTRPEDERLLDPFRTTRPPNHLVIHGLTRWRIASARIGRDVALLPGTGTTLFTEVSRAHSSPRLRPVLLDPRDISGADVAWHLTIGLRLSRGAMAARSGRYGAAAGSTATDRMLGMSHSTHDHEP